MDATVVASMLKWPNVPDCYGWLHLDAKGHWRMGEIRAGEPSPSRVAHEGLRSFMNRNYLCPSPHKAWALQNGPQRVWVTLATAPLVLSLHAGQAIAHTGAVVEIQRLIYSSDGLVYAETDLGPAAIEAASMDAFSQGLQYANEQHAEQIDLTDMLLRCPEKLVWQQSAAHPRIPLGACSSDQIEQELGFVRQPMLAT